MRVILNHLGKLIGNILYNFTLINCFEALLLYTFFYIINNFNPGLLIKNYIKKIF